MPRYPRYRLNVEALRAVAAPFGDERQIDISKRTGIGRDVVSRLWNGRDLSLDNVMKLVRTYKANADDIAISYDDDEDCEAAA